MSRPHYSEARYPNPYDEASFPAPSSPAKPVQTVIWKHIRLVQPPQQDCIPRTRNPKVVASKHVHFDLPPYRPSTTRTTRITTEEMDMQRLRREEKEMLRPLPRQHMTPSQGHQDHIPRTLYPSMRPIPKPNRPTIYIITFAADLIRSESSTTALLASQVPQRHPPIPHLYTIDARNMRPPPPAMCDRYSGISPVLQEVVMQDSGARMAVRKAVKELLRFGDREKSKERRRRGTGNMEVSMSVCCHAGTHRSVAIAERIAQSVKKEVGRLGCEEGVRVVCRHVHRIKGRADPF
ncbi:hypothetical protein yc1106_07360 [Curvularia clavata]|uniref:RapZ C-terminal domain-containing protein n=1 Tax=Curvularia clavata TaxID=95742 RepID=A0A9Q8ZDC5_CURCL|nr:hypothetical protein yc1106_07360 [Curvularia clavata]